jgi:F-box and WD-40 domain protein 1/11
MNFSSINNSSHIDEILPVNINTPKKFSTINYEEKSEKYLTIFSTWNDHEQLLFIENLLKNMHSHQHGQVNSFLLPMLQRDFIGRLSSCGLAALAEKILGYLDDQSLKSTELVCREWYHVISQGKRKKNPIYD